MPTPSEDPAPEHPEAPEHAGAPARAEAPQGAVAGLMPASGDRLVGMPVPAVEELTRVRPDATMPSSLWLPRSAPAPAPEPSAVRPPSPRVPRAVALVPALLAAVAAAAVRQPAGDLVAALVATLALALAAGAGLLLAHHPPAPRPPMVAGTGLAAAMVAASADLVVALDDVGAIRHASPAATRLLARPAEFLVGQRLESLVHPDDRPALALLRAGRSPGLGATVELRLSHLQGHWVPVEGVVADLDDQAGLVLSLRDIRARKAFEAELRHHALHDPLTGLANRALFREHVEHALARLRLSQALPHAVMFVDLDGFKTINDSLGHAAGDEVLAEIAGRLRARVRPGDTTARLGGDEFAVLLENSTERDAMEQARWLLAGLRDPVRIGGKDVVLTGSVGIAFSDSGTDADVLLRNADLAMYAAKTTGKGRAELFRPEMQRAAIARLEVEADLRRAIDEGELVLHYQPIVAMGSRRVVAVEALVRWRHPVRGMVSPAEFIPVAEDSGLIRPLGKWVLEEACRQLRHWDDLVPGAAGLRVCVNASVRQIDHDGFVEEVAACLEHFGLAPGRLTLEITESLLSADQDVAVARLRRIQEMGVRVAVDDFGTGYSSLSYLRSLPIDVLKIDRSFVEGVCQGSEASAVARAVVKLARDFGLETVAEGIEEPEQAAELAAMGADYGQGYHLARPLEPAAMEAHLRRQAGEPAAAADVVTPALDRAASGAALPS